MSASLFALSNFAKETRGKFEQDSANKLADIERKKQEREEEKEILSDRRKRMLAVQEETGNICTIAFIEMV